MLEKLIKSMGLVLSIASSSAMAVCGGTSSSTDLAKENAVNFSAGMKIAKARGDINGMSSLYKTFYTDMLKQCSDLEVKEICGMDCLQELGEYHLFMASEIGYYYSKSISENYPAAAPDELLKWVTDGIDIVKNAKVNIVASADGNITDFFSATARFNILLTRLYMAAGDNWYQTISEVKLERLKYIAQENLNDPSIQWGIENTQGNTRSYYEQAYWELNAAMVDLPPDNTYAAYRTELMSLKNDLDHRLESLEKGFVFLDIDPEAYINFTTVDLVNKIKELSVKIGNEETAIQNLLKEWERLSDNQYVDNLNEYRRTNDISVTQSSYRVAKLDSAASEFKSEVQEAINELEGQSSGYEYEKSKFQHEFTLKLKLEELKNRQVLILEKKEIDVMSFKENNLERKLSDIRWMMNWNIALTNLQLQISQFDSQKQKYQSDIDSFNSDKDIVASRKEANQTSIDLSNLNISEHNVSISNLEFERDVITVERTASLKSGLCAMANRYAYLTGSYSDIDHEYLSDCEVKNFSSSQASYLDQMCGVDRLSGLRAQLAAQQVTTVEHALCTIGLENLPPHIAETVNINCVSENKSIIALATEIYKKEEALASQRIDNSSEQIARARQQIQNIQKAFVDAENDKEKLLTAVVAAELAAKTLGGIPEVTTCACSIASGIATKNDWGASVAALVSEYAWKAYHDKLSWIQYTNGHKQQIDALNKDLATLEENLAAEKFALLVQNAHADKAIAEITGQSLDYANNLFETTISQDMVLVQCDQDGNSFDEQVAATKNQFNSIVADISTLNLQSDSVNFSIDKLNIAKNKEVLNQKIITTSNQQLDIELERLDNNISTYNDLISQVESRKETVIALNTKLGVLESEYDSVEYARTNLELLKNEKILALSDEEFSQIDNVMLLEADYTSGLESYLDSLYEVVKQDLVLRNDVVSFQQGIDDQVKTERDNLLNQLQVNMDDGVGDEKERIFLASETELAQLTEGVPQFIKSKRQYVDRANRLLVLLRNRVNALVSLTGGHPLALGNTSTTAYVKTQADLDTLLQVIEDEQWYSDEQILVTSTEIQVPAGCALSRELSSVRKASFEISPFATGFSSASSSGDISALNGCYSLWSNDFDPDPNGFMQNMMLIDFYMTVDFSQTTCEIKSFGVQHSGSGYTFREASSTDPTMLPRLVVASPRQMITPYYPIEDRTKVDDIVNHWTSARNYLKYFPGSSASNENSDSGAILPLLGLPVIGKYDILLPNPGGACDYENATFSFGFIYASDPRMNF